MVPHLIPKWMFGEWCEMGRERKKKIEWVEMTSNAATQWMNKIPKSQNQEQRLNDFLCRSIVICFLSPACLIMIGFRILFVFLFVFFITFAAVTFTREIARAQPESKTLSPNRMSIQKNKPTKLIHFELSICFLFEFS